MCPRRAGSLVDVYSAVLLFSLLDGDPVRSGNDDGRAHVTEEPVIDDAHHRLDVLGHFPCILDGFREVEVDDVVAVVGDGNLIPIHLVVGRRSHPKDGRAPLAGRQRRHLPHGVFVAERGNLDGDWETGTEAVAKFRFVHCDPLF
jgi:hypothetical protein